MNDLSGYNYLDYRCISLTFLNRYKSFSESIPLILQATISMKKDASPDVQTSISVFQLCIP